MNNIEQTLMEAPIQDLAFIFQRRLLEQDGINLISAETLSSISNAVEVELINRMMPIEQVEKEYCYD